jgi:hypothetical protein
VTEKGACMMLYLIIGVLAAGALLTFFLGTMWLLRVRSDIFSRLVR